MQLIEKANSSYFLLGKTFEKQAGKQVGSSKSLGPSNKRGERKQIEGIFPQDLMDDLICFKLKEIVKLKILLKNMI